MIFFFLLAFVCSLVVALPVVSPVQRDVWVPPITYPTNTTVWAVGGTYNVTWNTSTKPSEVTNPTGEVYLRYGGATQDYPIAQGFPLTAGTVNVTIPLDTSPNADWVIVRKLILEQRPIII